MDQARKIPAQALTLPGLGENILKDKIGLTQKISFLLCELFDDPAGRPHCGSF